MPLRKNQSDSKIHLIRIIRLSVKTNLKRRVPFMYFNIHSIFIQNSNSIFLVRLLLAETMLLIYVSL